MFMQTRVKTIILKGSMTRYTPLIMKRKHGAKTIINGGKMFMEAKQYSLSSHVTLAKHSNKKQVSRVPIHSPLSDHYVFIFSL